MIILVLFYIAQIPIFFHRTSPFCLWRSEIHIDWSKDQALVNPPIWLPKDHFYELEVLIIDNFMLFSSIEYLNY